MQSIWQLKRSEFNHDWLKNQFLNRLNAFLERLRSGNPDAEKLSRFVREDLPEWSAHEPEARWLIDSLEHELSPKRFFDQPLDEFPVTDASHLRLLRHKAQGGHSGLSVDFQ